MKRTPWHDQKDRADAAEARVAHLEARIRELRAHLLLPKFRTDTTIQVADVNRWLDYVVEPVPAFEEVT